RVSRAPNSISTSRVSKCSRARPSSTTPLPRAHCRWILPMRTRTALVLISLLIAGCSKRDDAPAVKLTPVRIQNAAQGPAVPPIDTSGIVTNKNEMRLSFKMGGVVRRVHVQEGDMVKRGQRLAEIELTEIGAQVEQARQMAQKAARDLKR